MKLKEKLFVTGKGTTILADLEVGEKMPEIGTIIKFQNQKYKITGVEYRIGALHEVNSRIVLIVKQK